MELPDIPFNYGEDLRFVEIVYNKNPHYIVHVYKIFPEGKAICFGTEEHHHFRKFFRKLETKSVYIRLKMLKKLIRRLKKIIKNRNIPFDGVYKIKHFDDDSNKHRCNFVKIKKENSHGTKL